jgi:hypothetical protein
VGRDRHVPDVPAADRARDALQGPRSTFLSPPRPMTLTAGLKNRYSSYSASGDFKIGAVFTDLDEGVAIILGQFAAAP